MSLYIFTISIICLAWVYFWARFRDPFHPAIIFLPQFAFLYGYMPLELQAFDPERFRSYTGGDSVYYYQAITFVLIIFLIGGIIFATRGVTRQTAQWKFLELRSPGLVFLIASALGLIGLSAWLTLILNVGGFGVAYGTAYGGGWHSSGYIREMRYFGLIGALLIYMLRTGKGMRPVDWALIAICITPTLVHAVLGARRGPFFLAMVILVGGYYYFIRKRISLPVLVIGGLVVGATMLFLVANRNSIYLGSDFEAEFNSVGDFLLRWESNEYLIGGAVVRYTNIHGAFYGMRELAWLVGRILPSSIWPTVYEDLPAILGLSINLKVNGGVSQQGLTTITDWTPSVGSAEGFTGGLYLEFGFLAPLVAFLIGLFYGWLWKSAKSKLSARVLYLLALAVSVYLVMQAFDPWIYRLILYGLPAYFITRIIRFEPVEAEIQENRELGELAPRASSSIRYTRYPHSASGNHVKRPLE